jgi:hypothetical protein
MTASRPLPDTGGDDQPEKVLGFRELSERVVASVFTRYPWLYRVLAGILVLLVAVCVVAVVSRLSPLPLVPVPLFLAAGYALWRLRGVSDRRELLSWVVVYSCATLIGFWLIAVVGRWVA